MLKGAAESAADAIRSTSVLCLQEGKGPANSMHSLELLGAHEKIAPHIRLYPGTPPHQRDRTRPRKTIPPFVRDVRFPVIIEKATPSQAFVPQGAAAGQTLRDKI